MIEIAHLLALADEFERVTGVSDTTLSSRAFDDGKKLSLLRGTSDLSTRRFNSTIQWFSDNWPEGAVWPAAVPRPKVAA